MPLGPAGKRPAGLRLCSPRGRAARNGATRPPPRSRTAPRNAAAPGPGREFELKGPPPPSWPPACGWHVPFPPAKRAKHSPPLPGLHLLTGTSWRRREGEKLCGVSPRLGGGREGDGGVSGKVEEREQKRSEEHRRRERGTCQQHNEVGTGREGMG